MADIYKMVSEFVVMRQKEMEGAILGEIREIAKENGIRTELILNEKAIAQALLKSQKRKVAYNKHFECYTCPICLVPVIAYTDNYCPKCGQALDWEV